MPVYKKATILGRDEDFMQFSTSWGAAEGRDGESCTILASRRQNGSQKLDLRRQYPITASDVISRQVFPARTRSARQFLISSPSAGG